MNLANWFVAAFGVVVIVRGWSSLRSPDGRLSWLSAVLVAPALLLLDPTIVRYLNSIAPWSGPALRVAPFLLALFALWALGEAVAPLSASVEEESDRVGAAARSVLLPTLWSLFVLVPYFFVKVDVPVEPFTIVHSRQLPGLVYTLIYYTGAAFFAFRIAARARGRRGTGYRLQFWGGVLVGVGALWQYVLLIPVFAGEMLSPLLFKVFDFVFYPGVAALAAALNYFAWAKRLRRRRLRRMLRGQQVILTDRGLAPVLLPLRPSNQEMTYLLFSGHTRISDYDFMGQFEAEPLTDNERALIDSIRRWLEQALPAVSEITAMANARRLHS